MQSIQSWKVHVTAINRTFKNKLKPLLFLLFRNVFQKYYKSFVVSMFAICLKLPQLWEAEGNDKK